MSLLRSSLNYYEVRAGFLRQVLKHQPENPILLKELQRLESNLVEPTPPEGIHPRLTAGAVPPRWGEP